ncbi:MAG: glycosyl transferase family 2 protein [Candidatus Roizmanbacteria bacterium GW2011_GWA2_32_13]|uniref:Glycosyl transferase family 2 protein n=1 Tax=Candidatus Roizmanbacteria bacterium GW2011_GWA2_32_13 TaxID=1618475 RepID=A0A0F9YMP1_9BACT|nr:MAG: glycosyl transferase family 2 protein [Candidatus Roizmanbacteria bacterium GW2011_GWA2_32_13]
MKQFVTQYKKMKKISISIPCYNEQDNVYIAYETLKKVFTKIRNYDYEFIFVDNGSTDKTRELISKIAKKDKKVKGVFLSKNFGPESSGRAGLDFATGEAFVGIGCDLQDPPDLIAEFIKKWENTQIPVNAVGFGLYDRKVVEALKSLPEKYRFERGLTAWVGFKKTYITYERRKRMKGKSSYNFFDYIKHAERGIFGFSYLVLDLMVYGGFTLVFFSFLFIIGYLYTVVVIGNPIKASIPLMLGIVFFGGIQLLAISIIGKYIQVIVEETKNRPIYIVEDTVNLNEKIKK